MTVLFSYLSLALIVSFICSLTESVLLSTPQSFLTSKKETPWIKSYLNYKKNIDKPLAAILSLNTVAHTIGAAGVGAEATKLFGESYLGLISAVLTILILIISEIIPKTIGANYWRNLSKTTYFLIKGMLFITYPLVILSTIITKILSSNTKDKTISRDEFLALTNIGVNEGIFSKNENRIIHNILKLKKIKANQVMTPRVVITSADQKLSLKEFQKEKKYLKFSRIPIYSEKSEKITGYIFLQDILEEIIKKQNVNSKLEDFKRNILIVPSNINLLKLWEELLNKKEHISIIVNEYGGIEGIVTMEDIIESLIGLEIADENDLIIDMRQYAKDLMKKRDKK